MAHSCRALFVALVLAVVVIVCPAASVCSRSDNRACAVEEEQDTSVLLQGGVSLDAETKRPAETTTDQGEAPVLAEDASTEEAEVAAEEESSTEEETAEGESQDEEQDDEEEEEEDEEDDDGDDDGQKAEDKEDEEEDEVEDDDDEEREDEEEDRAQAAATEVAPTDASDSAVFLQSSTITLSEAVPVASTKKIEEFEKSWWWQDQPCKTCIKPVWQAAKGTMKPQHEKCRTDCKGAAACIATCDSTAKASAHTLFKSKCGAACKSLTLIEIKLADLPESEQAILKTDEADGAAFLAALLEGDHAEDVSEEASKETSEEASEESSDEEEESDEKDEDEDEEDADDEEKGDSDDEEEEQDEDEDEENEEEDADEEEEKDEEEQPDPSTEEAAEVLESAQDEAAQDEVTKLSPDEPQPIL